MAPHSKQSAVSAIASEYKVFLAARLKLTALYVLIVAVIIAGFSVFIYQNVSRNLQDAGEEDFSGADSHQHFVQNTLDAVRGELMLADIVILVTAAGLSFALAGRTLRPIQLSVEAQKAFAANASHELRTPLAVMRNDIEVFLRNDSQTEHRTQSTMRSNLEEIERMSRIVEDLLVLARSDNHIASLHEPIELHNLVLKTVYRLKPLAENGKVHLNFSSTSDTLPMNGSADQLERAISNIVQNSIEHTQPGGNVDVSLMMEKQRIVVHIKDTGSGIAATDIPHIFTRFYKGDKATGTGLGLSIVKEIIDQHGGAISIRSIEGEGTHVTISLPINGKI